LQKLSFIKSSRPPVPKDQEKRAKNRQKNEEQKRLADEAKAKKAKKAMEEDLAKCRRESRKVGLPEPESPEASISEGGGTRKTPTG